MRVAGAAKVAAVVAIVRNGVLGALDGCWGGCVRKGVEVT